MATRSPVNPRIGEIAKLERYGDLEIKSELEGTLYVNDLEIKINTARKRLEALSSGNYDLKFAGTENRRGMVNIIAGKTTTIHIQPYFNKARRKSLHAHDFRRRRSI